MTSKNMEFDYREVERIFPQNAHNTGDLVDLLHEMIDIRNFEEKCYEMYQDGKFHGTMHLSIGEEAIAAGVCHVLNREDYITSTHRNHAHSIAKGTDMRAMFAEMLNKRTGTNMGIGGSMHIADLECGNIGGNGIVGANYVIANGVALANKQDKNERVVVCFAGDGSTNQGTFHEALNMASIWNLPVIFVIENNHYAMSSPINDMVNIELLSERAASYGIRGLSIDGNNIFEVIDTMNDAVRSVRERKGPVLIEMMTYRYCGHSRSDKMKYRDHSEVEANYATYDPIQRLARYLIEDGVLSESSILEYIDESWARMDAMAASAELDDELSNEEVLDLVYAACDEPGIGAKRGGHHVAELTYKEAIRQAMDHILAYDKAAYLIGEDIGVHGGGFDVVSGLVEKYGKSRVVATPISESAILGCAIGSSMVGKRPIVELQFADFASVAFDQIVNQAAKTHFIHAGMTKAPIVIRAAYGAGFGAASQHSQSIEGWFANIPGLKIVMPNSPQDAYTCLIEAYRDNNPVVFLEHKVLYNMTGRVELDGNLANYATKLNVKATLRRDDSDSNVVLFSMGNMIDTCLKAAEILGGARVVDIKNILPFSKNDIQAAVSDGDKVLIVTESPNQFGVSAEIAICIYESGKDVKIARLGGRFAPIPAGEKHEKFVIPDVERIVEKVREL
ncbi:MAG: hypothetical protein LBN08_02325 [Lactobacillales bacterium]|jgi:TPP-dependent pyruvate/acetoin dehydrogenase alpha subunit/pyruvate/2-oxoglutarate/acetoin dehydrogenase E1 component|nr:hypothetical protein [Lactobacillales bacterium]